jgi:hypothetical protein
MIRKKSTPPKNRAARKQQAPDELKQVLRDAELKKFDPELEKILRRSRRKPAR